MHQLDLWCVRDQLNENLQPISFLHHNSFHLQESIDAKSQWFHTVAWTVPSILTIVVLIMKKVEGDVLSGACFVGLWDHVALLWFVIVPLAVCLALGAVLLIVGLSSLVKVISLFVLVC